MMKFVKYAENNPWGWSQREPYVFKNGNVLGSSVRTLLLPVFGWWLTRWHPRNDVMVTGWHWFVIRLDFEDKPGFSLRWGWAAPKAN